MKIFYNSMLANRLLFSDFNSMMLFGFVITKHQKLSASSRTHEGIHVVQYWETFCLGLVLWIGLAGLLTPWLLLASPLTYYLMYGVEWVISYCYHIIKGDAREKRNDLAYYASAFEMEAYKYENDPRYLSRRPAFAFMRFYGKL